MGSGIGDGIGDGDGDGDGDGLGSGDGDGSGSGDGDGLGSGDGDGLGSGDGDGVGVRGRGRVGVRGRGRVGSGDGDGLGLGCARPGDEGLGLQRDSVCHALSVNQGRFASLAPLRGGACGASLDTPRGRGGGGGMLQIQAFVIRFTTITSASARRYRGAGREARRAASAGARRGGAQPGRGVRRLGWGEAARLSDCARGGGGAGNGARDGLGARLLRAGCGAAGWLAADHRYAAQARSALSVKAARRRGGEAARRRGGEAARRRGGEAVKPSST